MKKLFATVLVSAFAFAAQAQMDERFYFPSKGLEMPENLKFDTVRIPVGGGDTLFNAFFKTPVKARGNVLLIHGAGGNIARYIFMTKAFMKDGFNVYMVDWRGYGRSTGKPTHQNIAADAPIVFESFRKYTNGLPVIIYGASMGSQIAAKMASDNASAIKGLVIDGGFTGINDLAAAHVPDSLKEKVRESIKPPYPATESLRSLRSVPKLFVHSKTDKDVPFALGEALYQSAAAPKELLTYPGDHLMLLRDDPAAILLKMVEMVTK